MQTCSNCGSESRNGAKFCTTCGSRLNQIVDTDQSQGWVSFPPPEPEPTPNPEPADATMVSPAITDEPDTSREPESVGPWGDVAGGPSDEELVAESTSESNDEANVATSSDPDTADNESLSSWANQWSMSDGYDENTDSTESGSTSDDRAAVSGDAVNFIAAQEIDTDVDADTDPVSVTGLVPTPDDHTSTPKERAQALIFELRELIDESFATPESMATPASSSGENGDALATLSAVPGDHGSFDSLRTILEKAREHPRDVDTMLNLLGEIDSLIALIDSHQRYVDAVETARQQLS